MQASMISADVQRESQMIYTGDDLDNLEPIVASLLTVMAEYACDDLSKVT